MNVSFHVQLQLLYLLVSGSSEQSHGQFFQLFHEVILSFISCYSDFIGMLSFSLNCTQQPFLIASIYYNKGKLSLFEVI